MTDAAVDDDLFCPDCGYSLRGIDDVDRCPECGLSLERARLTASVIPWAHRGDIGIIRAYLRTVAMAIRHPSRAAADVARPVSFEDAQKFRRATVRIAMVGPLGLLAWGSILALGRTPDFTSSASAAVKIGWLLELLLAPVLLLAMYAFLLAASGVTSYFFHPKWLPVERQNRAVALSYYACAPMALTPLSVASVVVGVLLLRDVVPLNDVLSLAVVIAAATVIPAVQAFASITSPMRMMRRATNCGVGRAIAMALALPFLWALLGAVIAVGIPAAYLFVATVIMSLVG